MKFNFVKKAEDVHGKKYDYSVTEYVNSRTRIKILCKKCNNIFEQLPSNHIHDKNGCPKCAGVNSPSIDEFKNVANFIHNNKYDYSLSIYKNNFTNVKIICQEHGVFEQLPKNHLKGAGCPNCKCSKGENKIRQFLQSNNILFEEQKTFENCRNKRKLRFDFYLPKSNTLIEYDGRHHFEEIKSWGGKKFLIEVKKRDKVKNKFAKLNNIKLVRISYVMLNEIEKILEEI
jgi:hypothetical protein